MFKPNHSFTGLKGEKLNLFSAKRAVFFADEAKEKLGEGAKGEKEPNLNQAEKEKKIGEGAVFDKDVNKTLEALAKKVYTTKERQDLYKADLFRALDEGVKKAYGEQTDLKAFWKQLEKQGCDKVTIQNNIFVFRKGATEKIDIVWKTEKGIEKPQISATPSGVPMDSPEEPAKQKETPVTPDLQKTIDEFKKWFGKDADVKKSETSINAGKYFVRNKDAGHGGSAPKIYVSGGNHIEASYSRVSGSAFSETQVKDPSVIEVNGVKYAHIEGGSFNDRRLSNGWVKLDLLRSEQEEDAHIAINSQWSNPEKAGNKAGKAGSADKLGAHFVKTDTSLYNYKGELVTTIPANRDKAEAHIFDKNLYKINNELYVRVRYKFKETEGWVKYSDLYTGEKVAVQITERDKEEKKKADEMAAERKKYEGKGKGGGLGFENPDQEQKVKLKDILKHAEPGDKVDITTDKGKTQTATFKNGDFYYDNGRRAIILKEYKVGELKKVPKAEVQERAKEGANAVGSVELKKPETRKGLRTYLEIAETILKAQSLEDLRKLGFQIKDEKSLKDIQKTGINPYDYAEILKQNQVGDTIFVILISKSTVEKLKDMEKKTLARRITEAMKLDARERTVVDQISKKITENKEKYKIPNNIVSLAKDTDKWNNAWETEGSIVGIENLVHIWQKMAPGRSENELRDLVRKFIADAYNESHQDAFNIFIKHSKLYTKDDGTTGTGDELLKEHKDAQTKYSKLDPKVIEYYKSGKGDELLGVIADKMKVNRDAGRDSFYGLSEDEKRFAMAFTGNENYRTYERYHYLNNLVAGSQMMMDGASKLLYVTTEAESVQERPLTKAENRLNSIFDRNDKGNVTQGDIAGEQGKEGELTKFTLFWIPFLNKNPENFSKFSSGESAFTYIRDICIDPNTKEVDEKKVMAKLNELLQLGVWGMARNPDINMADMYKDLGITAPAKNASRADKDAAEKALFGKLEFANLEAPTDENIIKYQKMLVQTGYLIDQTAGEGKVEKYEAGAQELNVEKISEKLSDDKAMRAIQIDLLLKGYPADEIDKVPAIIKSATMVAGAIVDVGTYDAKKGEWVKGPGLALGAGIPLGHGFSVGLGAGVTNIGSEGGKSTAVGQLYFGVGYSGKLDERTEGGVGVGMNLPLADLERVGGNKIGVVLGAGIEHTVPIDNSSWDFFIAAGVSTDLRTIFEGAATGKEGANLGVGAMLGFKWNPTKAMDLNTREKLAEYEMEQIDDAMKKGEKKKKPST